MTPDNINELANAEAEVERTRERVALSVVAQRDEVVRQTNWRNWFVRRPAAFLGAAFVAGFWLGNRR